MAVKFPLKMPDGTMVRTLEDLREHFDLATVLGYYDNGRLAKWLENGYYDDEAAKVAALDTTSADFTKELCGILGVDYTDSHIKEQVDLCVATKKNQRLEFLKQMTADDTILAAVDRVAFTQAELEDLIDDQVKEIYLCGKCFTIPGDVNGITFIGVNNPIVQYDGETVGAGIDFQNLRFNLDALIGDYIDGKREGQPFFTFFENNLSLGIKLLCAAANSGSAKFQIFLGSCYENGRGVDKDVAEAVRWYQRAADQGYAYAQNIMGNVYKHGDTVQQDFYEAVKWYKKAAEQGLPAAQNNLARCYWGGKGVEQNYEEAKRLFLQAAESGYHRAQYNLGCIYRNGMSVLPNKEEAIKWFKKAAAQGDKSANAAVLELEPTSFSLSEVVIHAVGGAENLLIGTTLDREAGTIDISVEHRRSVDIDLLRRFGVENVWIETRYDITEQPKLPSVKEVVRMAGGLLKNCFTTKLTDTPSDLPDISDETELVRHDLGKGWIHIKMKEITCDMENDFNNNVKARCRDWWINSPFKPE